MARTGSSGKLLASLGLKAAGNGVVVPQPRGSWRPGGGLLMGDRSTAPKQGGTGGDIPKTKNAFPPTLQSPASASHWPRTPEARGQASLNHSVHGLQAAGREAKQRWAESRASGGASGVCSGLNVFMFSPHTDIENLMPGDFGIRR